MKDEERIPRFYKCKLCGREIEVPLSDKELEDYNQNKIYAQDLKHLSIDQREIIISGICGSCFDMITGSGDE